MNLEIQMIIYNSAILLLSKYTQRNFCMYIPSYTIGITQISYRVTKLKYSMVIKVSKGTATNTNGSHKYSII